ncbi:hypothetical protein GCM10009665_28290 [Kitasatospora nipponensis]|uniref:Uncharacterized protein n=1 Tax=Kitasatospora nipponensis TaxID=258049 RepID=A0ABP4GSJ5_9ACTN
MTKQQADGAPPIDAADTYLAGLAERMGADGCHLTTTTWREFRVVVGSRSDRRARWFGTKAELFVLAAAVPGIDQAALAEFTRWSMDRVKGIRSGLPGARNAALVLPALISGGVQPSATKWATADARLLGTSVLGRPITVETPAPGGARVAMYRGRVRWGGMFTGHVLEKASLYFP